ncbi:MAG: GNAT family N-acetyltransferase [bacterium]
MTIERRQAKIEDTDFARSVHHTAYKDVVIRQFGSWDEEKQNNFFNSDWKNIDRMEIILFDDIPCGYCRFDYEKDQIIGHELVISPDFQGKKIPIRLGALKLNRALNLYRKLGFNDENTDENFVGMVYYPE